MNVLVYRLPRRLGFISGRSFCPHCKIEISARDLVPILSYISLLGRCRHCKNGISIKYPAVEIFFGIIVLLLAMNITPSYGYEGLILAILIAFALVAIALIDLENYIIADGLLIFLIVVALIYGGLEKLGYAPMYFDILTLNHLLWGLFFSGSSYLLWLISDGKWIGFGDVKYLFVLGLIFGVGSLPIVYGSIISGAIVGLVLVATGRYTVKSQLPFGIFLSGCALIYLIYGWDLVDGFIFFQMIREIAG